MDSVKASSPSGLNLHHYKFPFPAKELPERLKDIRVVLLAGCKRRANALADYLAYHLSSPEKKLCTECLVSESHSRLTLFKVGPALVGEHGMGSPSMLIALHEIFLMCKFADIMSQIVVIRFGTCGGLGIQPGTLCITNKCMDPIFDDHVELKICGKLVRRPCVINDEICQLLFKLATKHLCRDELGQYEVRTGATIATNDFYEEQGRTSGAICEHTFEDERRFLIEAISKGAINIEMESNHLVAFCHKFNVPSAVVCVTLNNRLEADHLELTPNQHKLFQQRLFSVLLAYVQSIMSSY